MKTVGIVAEYNPFHEGHRYHIAEAKRAAGADKAVVIMSGSFVQRGEPACADKFTRAKWAIVNGADMVIELPDVYSLSCAERFASGAVRILAGTGIVDSICFGSECGDTDLLKKIASEPGDPSALAGALAGGVSYPKAASIASGSPLSPNDLLGVEYIRAINKYLPDTEIYAVKRVGGGYDDSALNGEYSSAKAIRSAISVYDGLTRMSPKVFDQLTTALPRGVLEDISAMMKEGVFPATADFLSDAVLCSFRRMTVEETAGLPEVSEGLENLFMKHSSKGTLSEMLAAVKSKRYTMARLKRISMCCLLGISAELQKKASEDESALYARVLAVRADSEELLKQISEKARIPVIIRASDREKLGETAEAIEKISARAHAIRALGQPYDKSYADDSSYRLIVRQ